jgi:PhnB protein
MSVRLNPYLNFRDTARPAMEFYTSVFGGDLTTSTFAEFQMNEDPSEADKLMHAQLETGGGLVLMAADVPNSMGPPGANPAVSLSGGAEDEDELRGYWDRLSEGGTVMAPFEKAPWGDLFGMCSDRFGVTWLVNVAGAAA